MANNVTNELTFKDCSKERFREILEAIQRDDIGLGSINFHKIIPQPPFRTDKECLDWRIKNWDTKWEAYRDEDGLSLTLTETQYHMVIEDIHGNLRQFTNSSGTDYIYAGGVLEFIQDIYGNKLRFNYNSKGQTTSVDVVPAGQADSDAILYLTFLYNSLGALYRITNQVTGQVVTFEYGASFSDTSYISVTCAGPLRRVKYGHVSGSEIVTDAAMYYDYTQAVGATVGSTYRLSSAKDETTGTEIRYTYDWQGQVKSVTEYANNHAGQSVSFTYGKGYTEVRTSGADDILQSGNTGDDIITHYSIDRQGRAVSAYSTNVQRTAMYGATNCVYEDDGENDSAKNSLKSEAVINGVATNYVYNGSFEYGEIDSLGWVCSDLEEISIDYDGINSFERRLAISVEANTTQYVYQDVVLPNGTYTVSANYFVYANDGVSLNMTVTSTEDSTLLASQVYEPNYTASTQNSLCPVLTFDVDGGTAGSKCVRVKFEFIGDDSANGTVYLDRVMLENNIGAGSYNAIQFGGFENTLPQTANIQGMTQWDFQYASDASVTNCGLNGNGLSIHGNVDEYQYVEQTVNIVPAALVNGGLQGAINLTAASKCRTFTVSGFAKGSAQVPNEYAYFCLDVGIKYYGYSQIETMYFDFNKDLTDWQFLSATFTTQPGRIVESITVSCVYAYQPGVAYFDNISLVEEIGNNTARYTYTEDGLLEFMYTPSYCQYNQYDSDTRNLTVTWDSDGNGTANEYTNRVLKSQTTFRYDAESNDLLSWYLFTRFESETSTWNPATTAISKTEYSINAFGLNTGTVSYAATGTKDDATQDSNSLQLRSYTTYNLTTGSALFGRVLSAADTSGYTTSYTYGPNGQLLYEKYHDGSGLYYMYDALGRMTNVYPLTYSPSVNAYYADTAGEKAVYTYNSNRQMKSVTTASTVYTFTYDDFGNVTAIRAGDSLLASYTYGSNNGKLTTLTYGSGKTMHYSYDALDRVSEICYNDNESVQHKYIYTYTASGAVHSLECTESGRKYQYSYNSRGQLIGYTELAVRENAYTDLSQSFFWYDDLNRLDYAQTTFRYAVGDTNYLSEADYYDAVGYGYTYDNSASGRDGSGVGALTELEIFGGGLRHGATISYGYDSMYRLTEKTTTANENAGFSQTVSYEYKKVSTGRTSCLVNACESVIGDTTTRYTYVYDTIGNITRIRNENQTTTRTIRYTYDKLGQLTREDNPYLNKTYVYTYDNAGNRLSKKTYAYTTGTPGNETATESYNYTGDRLTQVGSTVYQYDAIGNPTTYNGYTLEWNGRKLMEMSMNVGQFLYTFAYNADGIRTVKTNGSTIHHYTLNGSQIVTETWTTKSSSGAETPNHFLVYLYDENGAPIGMQYRNKSDAKNVFYTDYFEKNLQGDIIAIYTENGTKIGSYTYDAWGNCTVSTESGATTSQKRIVRTLNPFRYRGYYYDTDTGLYYLQSRYYNPQWGRFLNADGYVSTGTGLLGYNMYAYCDNNPVMYMDLTGRSWESFWDDVKFVGEVLLGTAVATACIGLAVLSIAGSIGLTGISGGAGAVSIPAAVAVAGELLAVASATLAGVGILALAAEGVATSPLMQHGVGGKGWRGDKSWKYNVEMVRGGGDVTSLKGGVPTQQEALDLIKEAGGEAIRVDLGHSPGGVSTHTYPHIHYKINGSEKNVIRIIEVLP